jgi:predicted dehydrogenase
MLPEDVAGKIKVYHDYRELLDKEKIDAVFIPTTTHARALIATHAMQAGLDVYAEKPFALTTQEGRVLVNASRKYKRVFQVGTQQRSMPINTFASKLVRDGAIGKVHTVMACNFTGPEKWEPKPAQEKPDGLDWDMWCNQTELRPYHKELQFGWAQWWDYDNGGKSWGVSGWGTHALDQVQCALGTSHTGPVEMWTEGADEEGYIKVTMRYENGTLLKMHGPRRTRKTDPDLPDLGAIFIGDEGKIEIKRGHCTTDRPDLFKDAPPDSIYLAAGETVPHMKNFFECMRTRKFPNADVEIAQRSTTVCSLMTICRELNRKLKWDPKKERFVGDKEADKFLSRPRRKGYELPADVL